MMVSKRILSAWRASSLALCLATPNSPAATFGEFVYEDGATITITGYNPYATGPVVIPSTINGKTVRRIGPNAFKKSQLSGVTIPEGVTAIGEGAFGQCFGLTSASLPGTLNRLGSRAFEKCVSLRNLALPPGLTDIRPYTFSYCRDLESVTIPEGVTHIGEYAFVECSYLTGMALPSTLRVIGPGAFSRCGSLTNLTIPASLSIIGKYAFADCSGLKRLTIHEGVTRIGWYAFYHCDRLKSITFPASMTRIGYAAFLGCGELTAATFTGDAPAMEDSVFAETGTDFKVYFHKGAQGFSTPKWHGYPALAISPVPEISLQQPAGTNLVDGTAKRSFGTVRPGGTGRARTFTITNLGAGKLRNLAILKTGPHAADFTVTGPEKNRLLPGASTTFKITFKPLAKGTRNASIQVTSNDSNENPFDLKLTGMGAR